MAVSRHDRAVMARNPFSCTGFAPRKRRGTSDLPPSPACCKRLTREPAARRRYGASRSTTHAPPGAAEAEAVVEAVRAALPELDGVGLDPQAAPVRRARHRRPLRPARPRPRRAGARVRARPDHGRLRRRRRRELRARAGARRSRRRTPRRRPRDRARHDDLALHRHPREDERGARVLGRLAALARHAVREDREAALVDALEQHDAAARRSVAEAVARTTAFGSPTTPAASPNQRRNCSSHVGARASSSSARSRYSRRIAASGASHERP